VVTTGSPSIRVNGISVARIGDIYSCPIHGPNPIVTASDDTQANGRRIARVGDSTACGATLTGGSSNVYCN